MSASAIEKWQDSLSETANERASRDGLPRFGIRKILVAVDFSDCSREALGCAVALAAEVGAEIILLHVFEPVPGELKILESVFLDPTFRELASAELRVWHRLVPTELRSRAIFREARRAHAEILNTAAREEADLIVVGRSRRKVLQRVVLGAGSTTVEQVYKRAHCPVLVVGHEPADVTAQRR
jgi:nucleotide-binding universal stress UspA family protein